MISNFRTQASVDVLILAAYDPNPINRYMAVKALWLSAIDGYDNERQDIRLCLQNASADIDERIVDLANKALVDIERNKTEQSHVEQLYLFNGPNNDEPKNMSVDGRII